MTDEDFQFVEIESRCKPHADIKDDLELYNVIYGDNHPKAEMPRRNAVRAALMAEKSLGLTDETLISCEFLGDGDRREMDVAILEKELSPADSVKAQGIVDATLAAVDAQVDSV